MNNLPERLNMPSGDAIINTKIERPFKKPETKQTQVIPANIQTCQTCNKEYNQNQVISLFEKLPILPEFDYQNTCLNCIRQATGRIKADKYPHLCKLKKTIDELTIAYQAATIEYNTLDRQEFMITQEQTQALALAAKAEAAKTRSATAKASSKKPSTKKLSDKSLIMKILANLTPEQQATVLANIKAQAS